jgi:hypothetical protein
MSKVPWHLLEGRQARAHLVVGAIVQANGPDGLNDSTAAPTVLRRLVNKQKPAGDYAATVFREAGWPEVCFAFEDEADARTFAAAVQAEPIGSYPGWASQRAFEMDGAMLRALEASYPLPKREVKRVPAAGSSPPSRVPRGPRGPIKRYDEE